MYGFINVLKPPGMTSHDVVGWMRRLLGMKKIGHTGTLDPDVPGVLVLAVGQATRLIEYLPEELKSYRCELLLGLSTSTQDLGGDIIEKVKVEEEHLKRYDEVCRNFIGKIKQIPPMISAVHYKGKRLYELAREGVEVEREPREITIFDLTIVEKMFEKPPYRALLDITCSKGTYIRTLCHDIGQQAGCGAVMSYLLRTSSGPFTIADSWTLEELEKAVKNNDHSFLLPLESGISKMPAITVNEDYVHPVLNGAKVYRNNLQGPMVQAKPGSNLRIYSPDGRLLAMGVWLNTPEENYIRVKKVFK